jgi:hypothetical protein
VFLRARASVLVLGPSGYTEVVQGTNGFTCFIERPTVNDSWPMCYNRAAAEKLVPVEEYRVRLRAAGVPEASIADSVSRGYRTRRFLPPSSGAMAYMLSRYAWTMDPETAAQVYLASHLHFYAPYTTNLALGVDTTERPVVAMRVEREGKPDASIIVGVRLIDPAPAHP